ncbi:MAG: hypothetical protein HOE30_24020 [Deltaproteobacteria bacterium]|jgi:hypothetical protein|uniref:hypothetical protein n=1 Tax=Desulfobacula sp. TaxID=2593537 RepID=UPI002AF050EF|nr:hypothetical protein [Deltaproteobacteria bacterium]MBT7632073.1 hypothetical protein [Desulfobacula sp.]
MERQQLDDLTIRYTGFPSFDDLMSTNIIPTIAPKMWENKKDAKRLANAFDRAKRKQGSSIRAFREKDMIKFLKEQNRVRIN